MISVNDAENIILNNCPKAPVVQIPLLDSVGRILAQKIVSDRDYPPFDRVTMDGIGISYKDYANGNRSFNVVAIVGAGEKPTALTAIGTCIEIMTGAMTPPGVDCVIPVEMIQITNSVATVIESEQICQGWNIHPRASDCVAGTPLLNCGHLLNATSIAVVASEGYSKVQVFQNPKIAIVSSGNELVDLHEQPLDWQIRRSNSYAIAAQLKAMNLAEISLHHVPDTFEVIKEKINNLINQHDIIILSGAVSKGKFDYIPLVLEELEVKKLFHCVSQRPGKPFWFGISKEGKPVFALPGNPVSTITCFTRYVLPAISKILDHPCKPAIKVQLKESFTFKKELTYFLPVRISQSNATIEAEPIDVNGSGDFSSLAYTDGFIELPADIPHFEKGFIAHYYPWDRLGQL
jgi:molybdopterin molybdotransferase